MNSLIIADHNVPRYIMHFFRTFRKSTVPYKVHNMGLRYIKITAALHPSWGVKKGAEPRLHSSLWSPCRWKYGCCIRRVYTVHCTEYHVSVLPTCRLVGRITQKEPKKIRATGTNLRPNFSRFCTEKAELLKFFIFLLLFPLFHVNQRIMIIFP